FNCRSRDLKFSDTTPLLQLWLPEIYPDAHLTYVRSASESSKKTFAIRVKTGIARLDLAEGEEAMDAIVGYFLRTIAKTNITNYNNIALASQTVVIRLHHLLALSKRKLALSPRSTTSSVTKPCYPGAMIFASPVSAVAGYFNALEAEN
ncbi:uncharacterized protein BDR25DRAFT_235102, partial [Lindgomyces ingoldianus]